MIILSNGLWVLMTRTTIRTAAVPKTSPVCQASVTMQAWQTDISILHHR